MNYKALLAVCLMVGGTFEHRLLHADTEQERGQHYAHLWRDSDLGYQDTSAKIRLTLVEKGGASTDRFMRMNSFETESKAAGDKVLLTFEAPDNIKNSRVLIHSKIKEGDQVWLYLPALKRVKRVAAADRSGAFSGSEFSYEDIGSMEVGNYDYQWLRDEPCGDFQCAVVKQVPLYPYSGYSAIWVWYNKADYRQMKTEYYDRKGTKFKTLSLDNYQLFLGRYWRALNMTMVNHVTGRQTILVSSDVQFKTGIREDAFEPARLGNLTQ
ncbi:outer membrane lipoprotein-sorting protein [Pseudomonas sp. Z1-14]|uniref:outer membrane lipoprotein-sorting protein n=1 Tax=Pseudomonas sp. Z1-14 TaxID=2817409 RepID=UPI003DA87436